MDTGEVVVPGITPAAIWREHISRYEFAGACVMGKPTLDIACGTGYGAAHLAAMGSSLVVGADVSNDALSYARKNFAGERIQFVRVTAESLPFGSARFDVVVSFETVEHLRNPEGFLGECRRVLRDGGLFICSTPMRTSYRPPWLPDPVNPYHTVEYTIADFRRLLETVFDGVALYGQSEFAGTTVLRKYVEASAGRILSRSPGIKGAVSRLATPRRGGDGTESMASAIRPLRRLLPGFPSYIVATARRTDELHGPRGAA